MAPGEAAGQALEQRVTRAAREEMCWTKTSGGWAVQTQSGGLYLVQEGGTCSCPDATYRSRRIGMCKHAIALGHLLIEKGLR